MSIDVSRFQASGTIMASFKVQRQQRHRARQRIGSFRNVPETVTKSRRPSVRASPRFGELSTPSKPKCSSKPGCRCPQHRPRGPRAGLWDEHLPGSISRVEGSLAEGVHDGSRRFDRVTAARESFSHARARQAMSSSARCSSAGRTGTCRRVLFAKIRALLSLGHLGGSWSKSRGSAPHESARGSAPASLPRRRSPLTGTTGGAHRRPRV